MPLRKLAAPAGVLAYVVVRSFGVAIPAPRGLRLQPRDAPPLFAILRQLQENPKGANVDVVLLTDEFNASVVQLPQFGLLIAPYLMAKGRSAEAENCANRAANWEYKQEQARAERSIVRACGPFLPHGLSSDQREALETFTNHVLKQMTVGLDRTHKLAGGRTAFLSCSQCSAGHSQPRRRQPHAPLRT